MLNQCINTCSLQKSESLQQNIMIKDGISEWNLTVDEMMNEKNVNQSSLVAKQELVVEEDSEIIWLSEKESSDEEDVDLIIECNKNVKQKHLIEKTAEFSKVKVLIII